MKVNVRQEIIERASEIFSKYGYKKTTMEDIARAMNKGKSSIYYYFTSKEEIFEAVVNCEAKKIKKFIRDSVNLYNEPMQKIETFVKVRMKYFKKFKNLFHALNTDFFYPLSFLKTFRNSYYEDEINNFKNILDEGVAQNVFEINDTYIASTAIITAIKGLEKPVFLENLNKKNTNTVEDAIRIILYGIVRRN